MRNRVGVLGSGVVGRILANGFLRYGYQVMVGTRQPGNLREWLAEAGDNASLGSFEDAARFA